MPSAEGDTSSRVPAYISVSVWLNQGPEKYGPNVWALYVLNRFNHKV